MPARRVTVTVTVARGGAAAAFAAGLALALPLSCSTFGEDANPPADDASGSEAPASETASGADGTAATCGDTKIDSKNCGRCKHDCLGGKCVDSACRPTLLVDVPNVMPYSTLAGGGAVIAVNDTYVAWTIHDALQSRVRVCEKDTCAATTDFLGYDAMDLSADQASFLVATTGFSNARIFSIDHLLTEHELAQQGAFTSPYQILAFGESALFLQSFDENSPAAIYLIPKGAPTIEATTATATVLAPLQPSDRYNRPAGGPSRVYVSDGNSIGTAGTANAGQPPQTYVGMPESFGFVSGVAVSVDEANVYWTANLSGNGTIATCPGGAKCTAAAKIGKPDMLSELTALSLQAGRLYISDVNGKLASCEPAHCSATWEVIADAGIVGAAAADAQAVYWIAGAQPSADGGVKQHFRVMKLAK